MNTSSKSTNISISISQQSVLLILTVFVNSPVGRITVEKIWLRYITIANTTPPPHITHITNCQLGLWYLLKYISYIYPERYIICGRPHTTTSFILKTVNNQIFTLVFLSIYSVYKTVQYKPSAYTYTQTRKLREFLKKCLRLALAITLIDFCQFLCYIGLLSSVFYNEVPITGWKSLLKFIPWSVLPTCLYYDSS